MTASFNWQSKWLDLMGLSGGRGFGVALGVIAVAGAACHVGDGRPELLEAFILL